MHKRCAWLAVCAALLLSPTFAVAAGSAEHSERIVTGEGFGLEVSTGLIGVYTPLNVSLLLPKLGDRVQLGLRASWSMPAILVPHYDEGDELVAYLPWMALGSVYVHLGTPVVRDLVRAYFGFELLAGTTRATESGIIGDNVTIGATPYAGVELYVSQRFAMVLELGLPVLFSIVYADEGRMGRATQHGATGLLVRFGPRWYLGR